MPFVDVFGKAGALLPAHRVRLVPKLNVGVRIGLTVIVNVVVAIH